MEKGKEIGESDQKWDGVVTNITDVVSDLESLRKLLVDKAVFVNNEAFSRTSLVSEQARTIKMLEQRVEILERELGASITAAAHARAEKRTAEAAIKAAELRTREITAELENTTKVFELHMEELRVKQEEISKRDYEIRLLEAMIREVGGRPASNTSQ